MMIMRMIRNNSKVVKAMVDILKRNNSKNLTPEISKTPKLRLNIILHVKIYRWMDDFPTILHATSSD